MTHTASYEFQLFHRNLNTCMFLFFKKSYLDGQQQVEIKKSTRFDEFHRSNIALDNGIFCVTLLYDCLALL